MKLHITDRAGVAFTIACSLGSSAMQEINDAGFHELLGLCGGTKACGYCHVYVDPEWWPVIGPPDAEEERVIGRLLHRRATSRLSCQIRLRASYDDLALTIAPDDLGAVAPA